VTQRKLHLHVTDEELVSRRKSRTAPEPVAERGYVSLYIKHVMGTDLDFVPGNSGSKVTRDSH